ncbi:MAG: hypothetical protein AAGG38_00065 [Planctomycetota bacterium]
MNFIQILFTLVMRSEKEEMMRLRLSILGVMLAATAWIMRDGHEEPKPKWLEVAEAREDSAATISGTEVAALPDADREIKPDQMLE